MPYQIESFGISDLGLVRENNEDVFHEIPVHRFFVLADGMGGHNAGEVAAKEAVYHLSTSVCQIFSEEKQPTELPRLLHQAIINANGWVHKLSEQKKELSGMGTTLCCLLLKENSLIYANVGDSRIYRFRENLLKITEDHSHPEKTSKNVITRAIGTSPYVEPDINTGTALPGDIYFLCSDGLTDYVPEEEISTILNKYSCIKLATKQMIEAAKARGSSDNITVLMIKVLDDL
jgi:serine/threonine protein phosphatase PrpC